MACSPVRWILHRAPPRAAAEITGYDFATQARIVRGGMPTLDMISERLARSCVCRCSGLLKKAPEISVLGVTAQK